MSLRYDGEEPTAAKVAVGGVLVLTLVIGGIVWLGSDSEPAAAPARPSAAGSGLPGTH
jgi:hypothetical protein